MHGSGKYVSLRNKLLRTKIVTAILPEGGLWEATRNEHWRIPHIGLSSLGEIIGWARPDEFPPRNMRTSKGLRALGHKVNIGV